MVDKPNILYGGTFSDDRGIINFVNDFKLKNVNRFYMIEHINTDVVRAWQGHEFETKYFFPLKGIFVIAWVKIDNFENPSNNLSAEYKILNCDEPLVLHLPPGYANGLRALLPNSLMGVFSDMEVGQTAEKKRRYNYKKWFNWFQNFNIDI